MFKQNSSFVLAALTALLLCGSTGAAREAAWPTVVLPQEVESIDVGGRLTVNGVPLQLRGVLSAKPLPQVAAAFRASLGHPLVETAHGTGLVLGRAFGEFYATVQLEPAGSGTRGVVAVARLGTTIGGPVDYDGGQGLLSRFPAGSRLLSRTRSVDGARRADTIALSNAQGVDFNTGHVRRTLEAEGYTLERSASTVDANSTTLFFKGRAALAVAVIRRDGSGNTAVVLNTVTAMEPAK